MMTRASAAFCAALFGALSSVMPLAEAGEFEAEPLGSSIPYWVETMARINDHGDVAWSAITSGYAHGAAQIYSDGVGSWPLPVSPSGTSAVSTATSITERIHGPTSQHVMVVGSASTDTRQLDRRALVWKVVLGTGGPNLAYQVELSSAFTAPPMKQTIANGIVQTSPTSFIVVGSSRKQVSSAELPKPTYWAFADDGMTYSLSASNARRLEVSGANGNGILIDVAKAPNAVWACGNAASGGAYARATCWDIDQNKTGVPSALDIFSQASVVAALPPNVASSVVNRVRTLPIGSAGAEQTVVVGSAMVQLGPTTFRWFGWTYNLTTNEFWSNFDLSAGADNMAFDVTSMAYPVVGSAGYARGMVVAGSSATVTTPEFTTPNGTKPMLFDQGPLRATTYRQMINAVRADGVTCNVNDESSAVSFGTYQQTVSLSANGQFRLVQGSGSLTRLMSTASPASVEVRIRDTWVREFVGQRPADSPVSGAGTLPKRYAYTDVQVATSQPLGAVRFADALGCQSVESALGSCVSTGEAAFDIGGTNAIDVALSAVTTGVLRGRWPMALDPTGFEYAQFASRVSPPLPQTCAVSPVMAFQQLIPLVRGPLDLQWQPLNPNNDFDGKEWADCHAGIAGFDTDLSSSYDHCGACKKSAKDPNPNNYCLEHRCVGGQSTFDRVSAGMCHIANVCHAHGDKNKIGIERAINNGTTWCSTTVSTAHVDNACSQCLEDSATNWTPLTNACCNSGSPILDAYDRYDDSSHACFASLGFDRNDGLSQAARWVDPRQDWVYKQFDDWSDGSTCLAGGSGSPHSITNPGARDNGKYNNPRKINAYFTPGIDMADWYEVSFDDDGDSANTPRPRARLISEQVYPGTSRRVRMELCVYVDCSHASFGNTDIKIVDYRGTGRTVSGGTPSNLNGSWVHNAPTYDDGTVIHNSDDNTNRNGHRVTRDSRGICQQTNDAGVIDISIVDYDCRNTAKEDAYVFFGVRPVDNVDDLLCHQLGYRMYIGNDKASGTSAGGGSGGTRGCSTCCN